MHLEKAKYLWKGGQTHKAIYELQSVLAQQSASAVVDVDGVNKYNLGDMVMDVNIDTTSDKFIWAKV